MPDNDTAIIRALSALEGAKTHEELGQVAEHWWGTLQEPMAPLILQQVIKNAKSEEKVMDMMRLQRFLHNAKQYGIPWAVTEEERIHSSLIDATGALFTSTPATVREVVLVYQALFLNTFGIYFTRWADRKSTEYDQSKEPDENVRRLKKERRLIAIQFLEDARKRHMDYAEKRYRKNFAS